jgi:seryl-tRNA synthetase
MNWMRWVRRELLAYKALQADRRELLDRIAEMDEDIKPRLSHLDEMPRAKGGLPHSSVETQAILRDESAKEIMQQLQQINRRLEPIERALSALDDQEREVIQMGFHSMDEEQPEKLGLSPDEFESIKCYAMQRIGRLLILYGKQAG